MSKFLPHVSVAGGLLDLLARVQNGEATCMRGAQIIEEAHEEEFFKLNGALNASEEALVLAYDFIDCFEDGTIDASKQSLEANHALSRIRIALSKIRAQNR